MTPAKYSITIFRGGTWSIGLTSESIAFEAYDEIRMHIRPPWVRGIPTKAPLLELTLDNGRILLENSDTVLTLIVSAADTEALTFDEGIYDLEMVKHVDTEADPPIPVEVVDKLLYGSVTVEGERTV